MNRRNAEMEEALSWEGFILVAWFFQVWPGHNELWAYWIPETGPRWAYLDYQISRQSFNGKKAPFFRYSRAMAKRQIEHYIEQAEIMRFDFSTLAMHLLEPGPDRRTAYLERLAREKDLNAAI